MGETVIEILFTLIIIAVLIIRGLKSLFEQSAQRRDRQDQGNWEDEWSSWEPSSPPGEREQPSPWAPASAPEQSRNPPPAMSTQPSPVPRRASAEDAKQQYESAAPRREAGAYEEEEESVAPWRTQQQAAADMETEEALALQELVQKSLSPAFSATLKPVRATALGQRRPIAVNARGTGNLRRGVLMREVLERPRAFDL